MRKRPTPETESIKYHGTDETDAMVELWESCHLPVDFARRMEAERNEARRLADTRLDQLEAITSSEPKDYLGLVYACKSHRKHIAQLIKERDEAREEMLRWKKLASAYETLTPPIGEKRLLKIAYRDGWNCAYCGVQTLMSGKDGPKATVDHVVPKCKGGVDHISNCVLACDKCNNAKGGEEWG